MKVGISLLLLAVSVAAVTARYRSGYDCRKVCGRKYVPVCSTENKNYDNECMLKCDWSFKECDGRCPCYRPPPRPIPYYGPRLIDLFEPRPTYYYESAAPSDCNCAPDNDKVCTADGETYDNECEAICDGKVKVCDGQCPCS